MDAADFDNLARRLARPIGRRRLLAGAAGLLASLGRRRRAGAAHNCCGTAYDCGDCTCMCMPDGSFQGCCCGATCLDADDHVGACCHAPGFCCGGACCSAGTVCAVPGSCLLDCPGGTIKCGTICCPVGQVCVSPQLCSVACLAGQTRCGEVCCDAGCDVSGNCAVPCENGLLSCKGTCILPCGPGLVLNSDTCACECPGEICGLACCPTGKVCASPAYLPSQQPTCCAPGQVCDGVCVGPGVTCCKPGPLGVGLACNAWTQTCCGHDCCPIQGHKCQNGKCVKVKNKKHHH